MTARDDYPYMKIIDNYKQMCAEIDRLRDFNQRLMKELSKHGWGDFHYGPVIQQDHNIVALLEEGGYQYDRSNEPTDLITSQQWEYNQLTVRGEPESLVDRTTNIDPRSIIQSPTDAPSTGGDREPGEREDSVGRRRRRQIFDGLGLLHEEGGSG